LFGAVARLERRGLIEPIVTGEAGQRIVSRTAADKVTQTRVFSDESATVSTRPPGANVEAEFIGTLRERPVSLTGSVTSCMPRSTRTSTRS
jgi:hypothetical protein